MLVLADMHHERASGSAQGAVIAFVRSVQVPDGGLDFRAHDLETARNEQNEANGIQKRDNPYARSLEQVEPLQLIQKLLVFGVLFESLLHQRDYFACFRCDALEFPIVDGERGVRALFLFFATFRRLLHVDNLLGGGGEQGVQEVFNQNNCFGQALVVFR